MIERWRAPFDSIEVIDDPVPRGGALNMALDEVLLDGLRTRALLRIYRWANPAVSFGCFGRLGEVTARWPDREAVRRWTGGGIVEHSDDLTFSLMVPRELALFGLPVAESYRFIHCAVASALSKAGCARASLQVDATGEKALASGACFENPVMHDLMLAGQKVAGGAQRRTRRGLLHQGSIREVTLAESVSPDWQRAVAAALPPAFGVHADQRTLSEEETAAAAALARIKYDSPAWRSRF